MSEITKKEELLFFFGLALVFFIGIGVPTLIITWLTNGHSCEILPMVIAGWCCILIMILLIRNIVYSRVIGKS